MKEEESRNLPNPEFLWRKDPQVFDMGADLNLYPVLLNSETRVTWHTSRSRLRVLGVFYHLYLVPQLNIHTGSNPTTLFISFFLPHFFPFPSPFLRQHWVGSVPNFTEHLEQFSTVLDLSLKNHK